MRIPPSGPGEVPGFSAPGLKDAVAQSRGTGMPVFDVKTASDLLSKAPDANHRKLLMDMAEDPVNFVKSNFSLTEKQASNLANLTSKDTQLLRNAAGTAMRENKEVKADCGFGTFLGPLVGTLIGGAVGGASDGPVGTSDNLAVSKSQAPPGSMAAMNGFSGTVTIHMKEMEG